jgi:hypothetical protein
MILTKILLKRKFFFLILFLVLSLVWVSKRNLGSSEIVQTRGEPLPSCPINRDIEVTMVPYTGYLVLDENDFTGPPENDPTGPSCEATDSDPSFNVLVGEPGGVTTPDLPQDPLPADLIAPQVVAVPDRSPNSAGWYNSPVVINFASTDPAPSSGTPSVVSPLTIGTEGKDQSVVSAPSCDPIGNCASGKGVVSIDLRAPSLNVTGNLGSYQPTETITITCTARDDLSGLETQSCPSVTAVASSFGPGLKNYVATATDKAGNTSTTNFSFTVSAVWPPSSPVAIGAITTTGPAGAVFGGSGHTVSAQVRSESSFQVTGSGHSFTGGVKYVSTISVAAGTVVNPAAAKVSPGLVPSTVTVADYRAGGPASAVLGGSLQSVPLAKCVGGVAGTWTPFAAELTNSTVYYVPCGLALSAAGLSKNVSFIAEGPIKVTGTGVSLLAPFPSTPALLSGSNSGESVAVSGTNVTIRGSIRTPGGIAISGNGSTVCSLLASTITVRGANTKISAC